MRDDHKAGTLGFQPFMRAEVCDVRSAGPKQRTHQIRAVPAEDDDAGFVLDWTKWVEQGGPWFWRLQLQAGQRAARRDHRMGMCQHEGCSWTEECADLIGARFMTPQKIDAIAYKCDQCRGWHI